MSLHETLDYISHRVSLSGATGALAGIFVALYHGHDSLVRTSSRTALSCALVGTACFTAERCVSLGVNRYLIRQHDGVSSDYSKDKEQYYLKLYSHTLGGLIGGALVGSLYTAKPIRGALFFAPVMCFIAMAEEKLKQKLQDKQLGAQFITR